MPANRCIIFESIDGVAHSQQYIIESNNVVSSNVYSDSSCSDDSLLFSSYYNDPTGFISDDCTEYIIIKSYESIDCDDNYGPDYYTDLIPINSCWGSNKCTCTDTTVTCDSYGNSECTGESFQSELENGLDDGLAPDYCSYRDILYCGDDSDTNKNGCIGASKNVFIVLLTIFMLTN